ncbi:hypothetical protein LTR36_001689 [Oleoguttula mirabilis]|uniref:25S rRNA (Uridine(2843)-N(3))-methyltransferase n=1 Tax=Oleoguttula mirabilis TaxID=1507867 RepID=A0AAV9JN31_9PEZI|nr:hypothetical protein LTR36_001689 [Oleoguttula mirabilis]
MAKSKGSWKPRGKITSAARGSKSTTAAKDEEANTESTVPVKLLQRCLNIYCDALRPGDEDGAVLQEVKGHLYNRDFSAAFGKEEYLRVYASRWSPSRALGYLQIFTDVQEYVLPNNGNNAAGEPVAGQWDVVCLGSGGGAELVALGAWMNQVRIASATDLKLSVSLVDVASWTAITDDLQRYIMTPPALSQYASAAAKEANAPLVPESALQVQFCQQDLLEQAESEVAALVGKAKLVTLMFTLNELYSANMPKTQRLLSYITSSLQPDALLLVVDSPGSYSTVTINGAEKKYPMQWLLDYTLLDAPRKAAGSGSGGQEKPKWERVLSEDSRWFRLPLGLLYPIELEDMRYQMHMYRRLAEEEEDEEA